MHTTITTRLVRQSLENVLLGMTCRWVVIADLKSIRLCQSICTMVEVVSSGCAHAAVADNDHRRYDSALFCWLLVALLPATSCEGDKTHKY